MDLHDIFQDEYHAELGFGSSSAQVWGLEIWTIKNSVPVIRHEAIKTNPASDDLDQWLDQRGQFTTPDNVTSSNKMGSMRLLYFYHTSPEERAKGNLLPFTQHSWKRIMNALDLPKPYPLHLASRRQIPPCLVLADKCPSSRLGFIFQSPALIDSFTTFALNFEPKEKSVSGFLGFQMGRNQPPGHKPPGFQLLEKLRHAPSLVNDPVMLILLLSNIWVGLLHYEHRNISRELHDIQHDTGLMSAYFRRKDAGDTERNFDSMHQRIILQHAYLTNGIADFVSTFEPSLTSLLDKLEVQMNAPTAQPGQEPAVAYDGFHARQYVEFLSARAGAEMIIRGRMLDRIDVYLQVLYNLMQQQISNGTKQDSSAMKTIALLTMIFLPATALATIASPFITMTDDDGLRMSSQFWKFWAVAAPVTALVLIVWAAWIRRKELKKYLQQRRTHLEDQL